MKEKYDRILMIAASVIAILVSGFVIFKASGFANNFRETPGRGTNNPPAAFQEEVESAVEHMGQKKSWVLLEKKDQPGKALRLLRSVALVQKAGEGQIIDLDAEPEGELRPPIKNWYLRKHNLAFERNDVTELDPDGDGFTNVEEFLWGQTDPNDKGSLPEFWRKLELQSVKFSPYSLEFRRKDGETFDLRREREGWRGKTIYAELNEPFRASRGPNKEEGDEERFTITAWDEAKKEITINDTVLNKDHKIVEGDTLAIPYKLATLDYTFPGSETTFTEVREGQTVDLPEDEIEYTLKEVNEADFVRISFIPSGEQNPKEVRIPEN